MIPRTLVLQLEDVKHPLVNLPDKSYEIHFSNWSFVSRLLCTDIVGSRHIWVFDVARSRNPIGELFLFTEQTGIIGNLEIKGGDPEKILHLLTVFHQWRPGVKLYCHTNHQPLCIFQIRDQALENLGSTWKNLNQAISELWFRPFWILVYAALSFVRSPKNLWIYSEIFIKSNICAGRVRWFFELHWLRPRLWLLRHPRVLVEKYVPGGRTLLVVCLKPYYFVQYQFHKRLKNKWT